MARPPWGTGHENPAIHPLLLTRRKGESLSVTRLMCSYDTSRASVLLLGASLVPGVIIPTTSGMASVAVPDIGVSAWALTRVISPRGTVRVAARDAYGQVINAYDMTARVAGDAPSTTWAMYLTSPSGAYRFLGFDLDAASAPAAVERDLPILTGVLDEAGIPYVVCASGGLGSRHVWVGLAEDVDAVTVRALVVMVKRMCSTLDITPMSNPATGCLRPPGAPHRNGEFSQVLAGSLAYLTDPVVTAAQVLALVEHLVKLDGTASSPAPVVAHRPVPVDEKSATYIPGPKRPLPPSSAAALEQVPRDPSAALARILAGAAASHWHLADVADLVATAPGLEHVRTQRLSPGAAPRSPRPAVGRRSSTMVLREQWARAVAYVARTPRVVDESASDDTFADRAGRIADLVDQVQVRAAACPGRWAARGGPADRRVLDALCLLALTAVAGEIEADTRRLALMCGIGRETARTALHRLASDGAWVARTLEGTGPYADTWRIAPQNDFHKVVEPSRSQGALPRACSGSSYRSSLMRSLTDRLQSAAHDVFTPAGGLGHHAGNIYSHLQTDPTSMSELMAMFGDGRVSLETSLDRLAHHGLVFMTRDGWRRRTRDGRTRAARLLGIHGRLRERAELYALERELWAWWQTEEAWMKAPRRTAASRRAGPGQLSLVDVGPPAYGAHPRRADGRADFRAARSLMTKYPDMVGGGRRSSPTGQVLVEQLLGGVQVA